MGSHSGKEILTAFSSFVDLNSAGFLFFFHTAPQASFKIPGYRPSNMDKRFLIWSGRFKTVDQIPEFVSWVASSCLFHISQRNLSIWLALSIIGLRYITRTSLTGGAVVLLLWKADVFNTRSSKEESVCGFELISTGWWPYLICCWDKSWLSRTHTHPRPPTLCTHNEPRLCKKWMLWLLLTSTETNMNSELCL